MTSPVVLMSMPSSPPLELGKLKYFKLSCEGFKIPIRTIPNPSGIVVGFVQSGETICVYEKTSYGFYLLQDKSVRLRFLSSSSLFHHTPFF